MAALAKVCLTDTTQMKAFIENGQAQHIVIAAGPQDPDEMEAYREFMKFLETYPNLSVLDLGGPDTSGHNCGIYYGAEFYDIVEHNPELRQLKLRRIRNLSLTRLGRILRSQECQLTYLKLANYHYSDVRPIFRALKWNSSLRRFKFKANPRGNDGLEVEAEAVTYLARAVTLKEFSCSDFLEMEDAELWERPELVRPLQALSRQASLIKLRFCELDLSEKVDKPLRGEIGLEIEYQILTELYRISKRLRKNLHASTPHIGQPVSFFI